MGGDDQLPATAPQPGSIFADRYRIDSVLGIGGMGFVLAATHLDRGERFAIKMLLPALASDAQTVERFLREGRAAIKIRSEHIARIAEVGELPDRTPFLVMEYLDGSDLSDVIQKTRRVPFDKAVDWILEACEAISEAHAIKIVHRDLKPANLFLARRPNGTEIVKVLDFGISKMSGDGNLAMTKTTAMLGSPLYMSPEQLKSSRNVDERCDIWALGVVLFELITGSPPFMAETLAELGVLVLSNDAPRLSHAMPDVPHGLSDVVATCLQKRPDDRFVNLADFAAAVAPFGGPGALESTRRITQTLGMPNIRATLARSAPVSSPEIALKQTQQMNDASSNQRWTGGSAPLQAGTPASSSSPFSAYGVTAAPRKGSGTVVAIGAVISAALLVAGGILVYMAKVPAHTTHAATSASVVDPLPSATAAAASALSAAASSSAPTPAEVASTTPAASSSASVAHVTPKATTPRVVKTATTVAATAQTTAPAPSKPASPSGIATSSKD